MKSVLLTTAILQVGLAAGFQPLRTRSTSVRTTTTKRLGMTEMNVVFDQVDQLWQAFPYPAAAVVCGVKASAADLVAQQSSSTGQLDDANTNNKSVSHETDLRRNLSFVIYGALYQGMAHEFLFNHCYPLWFGTGTDVVCVATKVLFNLLVQTTLVTLPVGYLIQSLVKQQTIETAFGRYLHDVQHKGLLLKCFALWGPVQCFTFSVVPEHWRVSFIALVSFFWLILFSSISAEEQQQAPELAKEGR